MYSRIFFFDHLQLSSFCLNSFLSLACIQEFLAYRLCLPVCVFSSLIVVVRWPLLFVSVLVRQVSLAVISYLRRIRTLMNFASAFIESHAVLMTFANIAMISLTSEGIELKLIMRSYLFGMKGRGRGRLSLLLPLFMVSHCLVFCQFHCQAYTSSFIDEVTTITQATTNVMTSLNM